jgi:antitoxin component YwqK of YwqJK toxin-antitoxin module
MAKHKTISLLKKLFSLFLFIVFLTFLINSCGIENTTNRNIYEKNGITYSRATDEPFTGRVIDTVGNRIIEYDVVKGLKNGEFIIYFLNHQTEICGKTKNNKNEGKWSYFYPNGKLESQGNFKNDLPSEKWIWYYLDGTIKEEGYFINGKKEGKWTLYDEKGNLKTTFIFRGGEVVNQVEKKKSLAV